MDERILFLTGRLAHDSLCREIEGLKKRRFSWRVHELGLQVAGLMTADMIRRRLRAPEDVHRIVVPGLCGGDVEALSQVYGVPVERGPKDLKDLPEFFGTAGRRPDLSGRRQWPTVPAGVVSGVRLCVALAHVEVEVARWKEDELRPRIYCRALARETHAAFEGFNRAQAAVIETAIPVSRLHMLPAEKIEREMDYLHIAVEKTAGPREREAWQWLVDRIAGYRGDGLSA